MFVAVMEREMGLQHNYIGDQMHLEYLLIGHIQAEVGI